MIKCVLWDIDGTLLDFLAAEAAGIRSCFRIFGLGECSDAMLRTYSAINVRYWEKLERGEMTKPEILVGRFREFLGQYGLDCSVAEAFNVEYQLRLGDTVCFMPYAEEVLQRLRGKVIQCAVTNGTKIAQNIKFRKSGLDRIFDRVFISEEVGFEKPRKEFFEAIFQAFPALQPQEMMIVGDSLTSDIPGGVQAGLVSCWFNPGGRENTSPYLPDHEIRDLREVIAVLEAEGALQPKNVP